MGGSEAVSDRKKFPHADAMLLAERFKAGLLNFCEPGFIAIAGSLRRERPMVGDIEILFVPKPVEQRDGLFDTKMVDATEQLLESWLTAKAITRRLNVNGHVSSWGPENKHAVHLASGIPVDLFATTVENWWVSLVIRTGSKETNLKLTTGAQRIGRKLNAYGKGITESDGTVIPATSERHVFELCNVPYLEPYER